jgi:hypothetical protein
LNPPLDSTSVLLLASAELQETTVTLSVDVSWGICFLKVLWSDIVNLREPNRTPSANCSDYSNAGPAVSSYLESNKIKLCGDLTLATEEEIQAFLHILKQVIVRQACLKHG